MKLRKTASLSSGDLNASTFNDDIGSTSKQRRRRRSLLKSSRTTLSALHSWWITPIFRCSISRIMQCCGLLILLLISLFLWFLFYGHYWTCSFHKALCTPYFMYLQNHNNPRMDGNQYLIDYNLKQKALCENFDFSSMTPMTSLRAVVLSENGSTEEWIHKLIDYQDGMTMKTVVMNQSVTSCSQIIDEMNNVSDTVLHFVINGNWNTFYQCLADMVWCLDLSLIDLIGYKQWGSGRIDRRYFQLLQFYPVGLRYLHITPQQTAYDHHYFDMALQFMQR